MSGRVSRSSIIKRAPASGSAKRGGGVFVILLYRLELAAFDEEVEETRVGFQAAMLDFLHQFLQFGAFRAGKQGDAGAFDGGVADLDDLLIGDLRDQPDALGRVDLEMAAEAA